jgi:putative transcriptional regulator
MARGAMRGFDILGQGAAITYIGAMDLPPFYSGQMLLAMPGIGDGNFDHAVIALCAHDKQGALGIDIGSEIGGLGLRELLSTFDIDGSHVPDTPVLRGGPVEPRRGFVLHSLDWGGQEMLQVNDSWGLSGSIDILKAIAGGRGPSRYLVALGYAGWGAGQLEHEMTGLGWFLTPGDPRLIFDVPTRDRWTASFAASGIDTAMLVSEGGSA